MEKIDPRSGVPIYLQLADLIESEIKSGMLAPGSQVNSENSLVKQYHVSRATVRQAYQKLTDRGFLLKIRGRGTFVTHHWEAHEELRIPDNKLIAFLMRDSMGGVQPALIKSVSATAFQHGYSVTINNTGNSLELALEYVNRIAEQGVKGILFRPLAMSPFDEVNFRICEEIQNKNIPFVFIDIPVKDVPVSCIRSNNTQGGETIGRLLRKAGHDDIHVLQDCINPNTEDRINGFQKAFKGSISIVHFYPEIDGDFERKVLKSLHGSKPPTAFFCVHDLVARQLFELLRKHHICIPDEVSVAGFDNLDFSQLLHPPLTTIHQPLDRMGEEAVHVLLRTIKNPKSRKHDVLLPVQLVNRESVKMAGERKSSMKGGK